MLKQSLFLFNFWLLVLIALLHHSAVFFYFYWTVWWFDILMHILGGMWAASMILWFFYKDKYTDPAWSVSKNKILIIAVLGALTVGILWEVFEIVGGIISFPHDAGDTFKDLIMDMVGGYLAYWNFLRYRRKKLAKSNVR
jgi:hypothetical protein